MKTWSVPRFSYGFLTTVSLLSPVSLFPCKGNRVVVERFWCDIDFPWPHHRAVIHANTLEDGRGRDTIPGLQGKQGARVEAAAFAVLEFKIKLKVWPDPNPNFLPI